MKDRLERKAKLLKARYHLKQLARRIPPKIPLMGFVVAFLLFLIVLLPDTTSRVLTIVATPEYSLTVVGVVLQEPRLPNGEKLPVPNATIEVGGYRAATDDSGRFRLVFKSKTRQGIPVHCTVGQLTATKRATFSPDAIQSELVFILQ